MTPHDTSLSSDLCRGIGRRIAIYLSAASYAQALQQGKGDVRAAIEQALAQVARIHDASEGL